MEDKGLARTGGTGALLNSNRLLLRRIALARGLAKWVLFLQLLIPASLWLASVVCVYVAFSWFGLFRIMPDWLRIASGIGFFIGLLASALPLLKLRWPDALQADRHLETYNHLPHQAVSVQHDVPSADTAIGTALWQEHQARMAARIGTLEVGGPSPDLGQHDPYGLRAIPVLALTIAFFFSGSQSAGTLTDIFMSHAAQRTETALRIDAWITPPAYTHAAPLYLTAKDSDESQPVTVPQFSVLTVRLSGQSTDAPVRFTPSLGKEPVVLVSETADQAAEKLPVANPEAVSAKNYLLRLEDNGQLEIQGHRWTFDLQADQKPVIAFDGNPRRSANGSLEIGFKGHDDYGFAEAHAEIVPVKDMSDSVPLYPLPDYRLDLPRRDSQDIKGVTSRNLTEHPMAGTRVRITLVATDGAGQEGRSAPLEMTMPARTFQEPLAGSVAEQRQVFALDANQVRRSLEISKALTIRPEETIPNKTHFLLLQSTRSRLALARSLDDLRATSDYYWQVALQMEDGDVSLTEKNLRDAQQALSDALARNAPDAEIKKLMDDLRKAMTAYLDAMQKRMAENPSSKLPNSAQNMLRQKDLQKMLDQLENLARSGSRDEAQKLLNEMQRMMNNLRTVKPNGKEQKQNSEMTKQIDKLGELLQNQQKLMDQTFTLQQQLEDRMQRGDPNSDPTNPLFDEQQMPNDPDSADPNAENKPDQGAQPPSPESQMTEQQLRDALKNLQSKQDELSKNLDELTQGLKGLGAKPGKGFGDAKKHMGDASKSLGKAQGDTATQGQGQALQALRDGAKDLMKQMQGQGQGQGQGEASANPQNMDPLGRQTGKSDPSMGEDVKVPDEIDIQRAREILEAIRKKLETNPGPELERQYLERLLDIR